MSFSFYIQQPITLDNINNNHSQSVAAMPLKDLTSDNENNFSMQRKEFRRTISNNFANQNAIKNNKKWYGNSTNRFSSRIVESHKNRAVGTSSLNWAGNVITMTKPLDYNYVNRSIIRVRRTGGAVPSKNIRVN